MTSSPGLISVIFPVYNGEKYLAKAIQSILNQTYKNFELIILDDGSTDSSRKIIESFVDTRIVFIRNTENLKLIKTLNKGISLAKGNYIARMDSDDIAIPSRLETQVQYLESHPDIAVLGSSVWYIDEKNRVYDSTKFFPLAAEEVFSRLLRMTPVFHPATMIRAHVIKEVGGYDESYPHAEDYALWLKIAKKYSIANLPNKLIYYRVHSSSVSHRYALEQSDSAARALKNFLQEFDLDISLDVIKTFQNPYGNPGGRSINTEISTCQQIFKNIIFKKYKTNRLSKFNQTDEFWFYFRKTLNGASLSNFISFLYYEKKFILNINLIMCFLKELFRSIFMKIYFKMRQLHV